MSRTDHVQSTTTTDRRQSVAGMFARAFVPVLIVAGGALAFVLLSTVSQDAPGHRNRRTDGPPGPRGHGAAHQGGMTMEADGVVVPYREIELAAEVAGRIVERGDNCRAGNYVTKGTLLARIDPQDYLLEKERLEKERQQASVALEELAEEISGAAGLIEIAEKQVALRGRELTRMQGLGRAVSETDLEMTENSELTARNALVTLTNQVRLLKVKQGRLKAALDLAVSRLAKTELDLQRTEIVAPVDGVIVQDQIEEDSFVQRATPLLTLEDTSKVEVKCKLEMDQLYWLWDRRSESAQVNPGRSPAEAYDIPETNVQVVYRLAGQNNREYLWEGRLARYDGLGLDEKTRTVPCRIVVDSPLKRISTHANGPPALLRGMYVTVRIQVDPETPLLNVPEEAVQPGNIVWCVRDNKMAIVPVNFVTLLDRSTTDGSIVRNALIYVDDPSQLTVGDQVVVSPLTFVRTGMDVEVSATEEP